MKKIFFTFVCFISINSIAQIGIGTNTPHVSSIFELNSTTKGLLIPRMSHSQKSAILSPIAGLTIWCTDCSGSVGQMQVFNGSSWTDLIGGVANNSTSNGSSVINSYNDCSTASAGTLTAGVAVSGVTQTLTLNVTSLGTYSISAIANGITFFSSGTFTSTGVQTIVLTASGTPTSAGTITFTLNTNPNCSFTRIVN